PFLTKVVAARYSPERLARDGLRAARALGDAALALPGQLTDILEDARSGRLAVFARDPETAAATERLGRRVFSAVLAGALLASATALVIADRAHELAIALYVLAAAIVAIHLWRDRP
ncbi:MAG: hypothetical protein ACM31C_30730, partial [Acidobacteriota bacterium]